MEVERNSDTGGMYEYSLTTDKVQGMIQFLNKLLKVKLKKTTLNLHSIFRHNKRQAQLSTTEQERRSYRKRYKFSIHAPRSQK